MEMSRSRRGHNLMAPQRRTRTFHGARCYLCKTVDDKENINIPVICLDGKKRAVTCHTLCAFKYAVELKKKEVKEEHDKYVTGIQQFNWYTAQLQQRIRELELQQARLIDTERYRAATALMKLNM